MKIRHINDTFKSKLYPLNINDEYERMFYSADLMCLLFNSTVPVIQKKLSGNRQF